MPLPYLRIQIGDNAVTVSDPNDLPITITPHNLESATDFQEKQSATALQLTIPATLDNSVAANSYHNPSVDDLTTGQAFRSEQPVTIESAGEVLLQGRAILDSAQHTDRPLSYTYDCYGDNANWALPLADTTLYDLLAGVSFQFTEAYIRGSWTFDGTDLLQPCVFAPVRYSNPPGGTRSTADGPVGIYDNYTTEYMRPAFGKYWLLYTMFALAGYRIAPGFFDLPYFRRQVLPWTFGNFLQADNTKLDIHKFLAKSTTDSYFDASSGDSGTVVFADLKVTNDSTLGGFDNNGVPGDYTYSAPDMRWMYNNPSFGPLTATFSLSLQYAYRIGGNRSRIAVYVYWYYTAPGGIEQQIQKDTIFDESGPFLNTSTNQGGGIKDVFLVNYPVQPGGRITSRVEKYQYRSKQTSNEANCTLNVISFALDYFRFPVGGTIAMSNYTVLKNYKALDLLRGVIDEFNLLPNTDPVTKTVYLEPMHEYTVGGTTRPGYFNGNWVDWVGKEDYSEPWVMQNFKEYERQLLFQYAPDSSDGMLAKIAARAGNTPAAAKHVLPARYKVGKREATNRFFSPTMHYFAEEFASLNGTAPQFIIMLPENVSNTSSAESSTAFAPKSAYYAGLRTTNGRWRFNGVVELQVPTMFAVNYQDGGQADPVLSYTSERIGRRDALNLVGVQYTIGGTGGRFMIFNNQPALITNFYSGQVIAYVASNGQTFSGTVLQVNGSANNNPFSLELDQTFISGYVANGTITAPGNVVVAPGLLQKFYWQRMAIMREGRYWNTRFRLGTADVAGQLFREHRIFAGQKWQCMVVAGYNPLLPRAADCLLYKHVPIGQAEADNTYPSVGSVLNDQVQPGAASFDLKYTRLLALPGDV